MSVKADNAAHLASDGGALLCTALAVALFLILLRAHLQLLAPSTHRVEEFQLTMQMEEPPAPQPPTPPAPAPRKPVQRRILPQVKPVDPGPVFNEAPAADPVPAVVAPAAESAPVVVSDPDLNAQYAAELRTNIDRRTTPPDTAQYRLQHPAGEVRVRFSVTRGGEPQAVALLRSSGYPLLDNTALNIVSSGHYAPMGPKVFVGEMQHVFVVTIEFRPQMRAAL